MCKHSLIRPLSCDEYRVVPSELIVQFSMWAPEATSHASEIFTARGACTCQLTLEIE